MAKKQSMNMIGSWSFLIGLVIAILIPLFGVDLNNTLVIVLIVIGLIIGLLNIADAEVTPFLLSGTALVIVSAFGVDVVRSVPVFQNVLTALLTLFVPATIIVAVKNVFTLAKH